MRKRLLRFSLLLTLTVSGYGLFAARATLAQCSCSCTYVCSGTCNVSCSGCTIQGTVDTALQCCQQEQKNVQPYCISGGGES